MRFHADILVCLEQIFSHGCPPPSLPLHAVVLYLCCHQVGEKELRGDMKGRRYSGWARRVGQPGPSNQQEHLLGHTQTPSTMDKVTKSSTEEPQSTRLSKEKTKHNSSSTSLLDGKERDHASLTAQVFMFCLELCLSVEPLFREHFFKSTIYPHSVDKKSIKRTLASSLCADRSWMACCIHALVVFNLK